MSLPNLIQHRISNFRVSFDPGALNLPEGDSLLAEMGELGGRQVPGDEPAVVYTQRYRLSNRVHHSTLVFQENENGDTSISMHALLGAGSRRKAEQNDLAPPLIRLGEKGISGIAHCYAMYELPRRNFKTLIPLPLQIFQKGSMRFERLMGFRLATGTGDSEETLVLDIHENNLHLAVVFQEHIEIDETLSEKVIKMSKDLIMPILTVSEEVKSWYALNS